MVFVTWLFGCAVAQDAQPQIALPGHLTTEKKALASSSDVVVARLMRPGRHDPGAPSVEEYEKVQVSVERALKGAAAVGNLSCRYNRLDSHSRTPEVEPSVGAEYMLFLQYRGDYEGERCFTILRFSTCTSDDLDRVQQLISSGK